MIQVRAGSACVKFEQKFRVRAWLILLYLAFILGLIRLILYVFDLLFEFMRKFVAAKLVNLLFPSPLVGNHLYSFSQQRVYTDRKSVV